MKPVSEKTEIIFIRQNKTFQRAFCSCGHEFPRDATPSTVCPMCNTRRNDAKVKTKDKAVIRVVCRCEKYEFPSDATPSSQCPRCASRRDDPTVKSCPVLSIGEQVRVPFIIYTDDLY